MVSRWQYLSLVTRPGGEALPKGFGRGVRPKPRKLYSISDQNLGLLMPYFRPEQRILTPDLQN